MKIASLILVALTYSANAFAQSPPAAQTAPVVKSSPQKSSASPTKPATSSGSSDSATKSGEPTPKPTVAADAPVITITGLCPPAPTQPTCTTTITKAEFEAVVNAIAPEMPAQAKSRFANEYAQALTVANEGQKLGVDKEPAFEQQIKLAKIQALARGAARKVQENAKPTPQEVEAFYNENGSRFEEISLRRIYIPKPTAADAKPEEAKAMADKIHTRAVAGEDFDKLEAEAYTALKAPGTPPTTKLGFKRHGAIDARNEKQISGLNAGQVSDVLDDPLGYSIYRVEEKRMTPLEMVKKDIENNLLQQRFQEKMQQLVNSAKIELNQNYFGTSEPPPGTPPSAPSLQRRPVTPPKD